MYLFCSSEVREFLNVDKNLVPLGHVTNTSLDKSQDLAEALYSVSWNKFCISFYWREIIYSWQLNSRYKFKLRQQSNLLRQWELSSLGATTSLLGKESWVDGRYTMFLSVFIGWWMKLDSSGRVQRIVTFTGNPANNRSCYKGVT